MAYRLCLIGYGKIARDQHHPVISGHSDFELVSVVSGSGAEVDLPCFSSLTEVLNKGPVFDAVVLCTPPAPRNVLALQAISAGKAVFLEKPPSLTVSAAEALTEAAFEAGITLFASWHSRFAPFVSKARNWAATRTIKAVEIDWREDVRKWHPGQDWLWQPGGMGVFDPGINALSMLTEILPVSVSLEAAVLDIPSNKSQPIGADLTLKGSGLEARARFDFRETDDQTWQIVLIATTGETLKLLDGGAALQMDRGPIERAKEAEYKGLYDRFSQLLSAGISEVDLRPLQLVADAFLCAERRSVAAFHDQASDPK